MSMQSVPVSELTIVDEQSFETLALYRALRTRMDEADPVFLITDPNGDEGERARLLNLGFWDPSSFMEVLTEPVITADQLAHNALHHCGYGALGDAARSLEGLLLVESIASAMDIYWLGRLLAEAPYAEFLESQVPAISEAASGAGASSEEFADLLQLAAENPPKAFGDLRSVLFDTALGLTRAVDVHEADRVLREQSTHQWSVLTHHYAITNWILFARINGSHTSDTKSVLDLDQRLRGVKNPVTELQSIWALHA